MQFISLEFGEDISEEATQRFKRVRGCIGVSGYKSTLNLYFNHITRGSLVSLSLAIQAHLAEQGAQVSLRTSTIDNATSTHAIYDALRAEAEI